MKTTNNSTTDAVQAAQDFAAKVHDGQVDRAGVPYLFHVLRVSAAGSTPVEQIVGALHDVIEDTRYTHADLVILFGQEVADAVQTLSRFSHETYSAFIERCAATPLTRAVKINDLLDNLNRLQNLPADEAKRKFKRYFDALARLGYERKAKAAK